MPCGGRAASLNVRDLSAIARALGMSEVELVTRAQIAAQDLSNVVRSIGDARGRRGGAPEKFAAEDKNDTPPEYEGDADDEAGD